MGQSTWKSIKECIGIRAQLRNPINTQLPKRKKEAGVGEAKRKIWVAEGFVLFFFLFFSFIFFLFYFFGSGCYRLEQKLNAEFHSFQITTWNVGSSDKFLEFDVPSFKLQLFLSYQRNAVVCNLIIEKPSFH